MHAAQALRKESRKAPLFPKSAPLEDRNLTEKLRGRRACIVVDDADYANGMKDLVEGMLGRAMLSSEITILNWSSFLCVLPEIKSDLIVLLSPRELSSRLPDFETGIGEFRKSNPCAVVMMNNLHSPAAPASERLRRLGREGLVDHIEQGFLFFPHLIHQAADALDAKV
jgi:hypothetical protein